MSTANFAPVKFDMPLIAYGLGDDYEERKKEYEEDNAGEYEYNDDLYASDIDFISDEMEAELKSFNSRHEFFEITQESGYYQGVQFQVEFNDRCYDYDTIMDDDYFSEDEAQYYYGRPIETLRKEIRKELEEVKEYLLSLKDRLGFHNLYKYAQFSNGEAIYKEVGEE